MMIKTKIYAIPLNKLNGYGYVEVFQNPLFGSQVRVFNLFTSSILSLDEVNATEKDDLTYRLCLNGEPRVIGTKDNLLWYFLGEGEIELELLKNVEFKVGAGSYTDHHEDWSEYTHWMVMEDFDLRKKTPAENYELIKHLPLWSHSNYIGLTELVQMFWLREKGLSIRDFYEKEIEASITTKVYYYEVINSVPYSQVPKHLRNKKKSSV